LVYLCFYAHVILLLFDNIAATTSLGVWTFLLLIEHIRVIYTYPGTNFLGCCRSYASLSPWQFSLSSFWWPLVFVDSRLLTIISLIIEFQNYRLSHIFVSICFIPDMMRLFKVYHAGESFGRKVIMITHLIRDLVKFLLILVVFLFSYTVVSQALLHQNRELSAGIYSKLIYGGTWIVFGELQGELEEISGKTCSLANTTADDEHGCEVSRWISPLLLAAYCIVGNILIVNMLIASFDPAAQEQRLPSDRLWRYYMYFFVMEYRGKRNWPPPVKLIVVVCKRIRSIFTACANRRHDQYGNERMLDADEKEILRAFEDAVRCDVVDQQIPTDGAKLPKESIPNPDSSRLARIEIALN